MVKKLFCHLRHSVLVALIFWGQGISYLVAATEQPAAMPDQSVQISTVTAQKFEKMRLLVILQSPHRALKKVASFLQQDLGFTNQFDVHTMEHRGPVREKTTFTQWATDGYPLVLILEENKHQIIWRLYDTAAVQMMKGQNLSEVAHYPHATAHALADQVWPALTGAAGFFSSKLVYSKMVCRRGRNCKRHLYIRDATDEQGHTEQLLVNSPTISVSPRWNKDANSPLVLYSEYTKSNVRLVAVNMQGKRSIVSNFDGVNMQVAYAHDGKEVAYCLSRPPVSSMPRHTTTQLYHYTVDDYGKPAVKRITPLAGNNFAPCWGPGKTIFYASDIGSLGNPKIHWYDIAAGKSTPITTSGFAVSPTYSPVTNRLAYTKMVNKRTQLFLYDLETKREEQLTSDTINKDECCWSPCGNLLAFVAEQGGKNRICVYNVLTREQKMITAATDDCCYPHWSPIYEQLPMVG